MFPTKDNEETPLLSEEIIAGDARGFLERQAERGNIRALKILCQLEINRLENMNRLHTIMTEHESEEVKMRSAETISLLYGAKKAGESWVDKPLRSHAKKK